jgi:hypothetical protein
MPILLSTETVTIENKFIIRNIKYSSLENDGEKCLIFEYTIQDREKDYVLSGQEYNNFVDSWITWSQPVNLILGIEGYPPVTEEEAKQLFLNTIQQN